MWMYTYLPENERKLMNNRITRSKELEIPEAPKEKIEEVKEGLLKRLENFSGKRDIDFKKMYSEKTFPERKKILMESQAELKKTEEAFKRWQEWKNKLVKTSGKEREVMWIEEKDDAEIKREKKRIANFIEDGGDPEEVRHLIEAILRREKENEEINKQDWGNRTLGIWDAEEEEKRTGEPVVFLGNTEVNTEKQLIKWLREGLNRTELEEFMESSRAGAEYTKRIIAEVEEKERKEKS